MCPAREDNREGHIRRYFVFLLLGILLLLSTCRGTLSLTPVAELAVPYMQDVVGWHLSQVPRLWWRQGKRLLPGTEMTRQEELVRLRGFFELIERAGRLQAEVERLASLPPDQRPRSLEAAKEEAARTGRERASLAGPAAEALESVIGRTLAEVEAPWRLGPFRWPPVGFTFESSPNLLVVSPRGRIQRIEDVLLRPDITVSQMEEMEQRVGEKGDNSALVVPTGGISFYPAVISPGSSLQWALEAAAHEWVHYYLFFSPLGQRMHQSAAMVSLNETAADLAGREIGRNAYGALTGQPLAPEADGPEMKEGAAGQFDFRREMRQTRLHVEELLGQDRVEEAEQYMDERRQEFVRRGYYIRKLNQAYFAFYGTYADNPASVSPIGRELEELREHSSSLHKFLRLVATVSSYEEFKALLEKAQRGEE